MQANIEITIGNKVFPSEEIRISTIEKEVKNILTELGLNNSVNIRKQDSTSFLAVNGHACEYSEEQIRKISTYIADFGIGENSPNFISTLVCELIWQQPENLLTESLINELFLEFSTDRENFEKAKKLVSELLSMRISIADRQKFNEVRTKYDLKNQIEWDNFCEELISVLRSNEVLLILHPEFAGEILLDETDQNLFTLLRSGLFNELGIKFPKFRIVLDKTMPPGYCSFSANKYRCIPYKCIRPGKLLINASVNSMSAMGIKAQEMINPANGEMNALIDVIDKEKIIPASNYTTWNVFGFIILCQANFLRRNGHLLFDKNLLTEYLEIERKYNPKLVSIIEELQLQSLTLKILRRLLQDGISILNFPKILESVLESDCIVPVSIANLTFDDRIPVPEVFAAQWKTDPAGLTEYVRSKLREQISQKFLKGQATLNVFHVDYWLEERITDWIINPATVNEDQKKQLLETLTALYQNPAFVQLNPIVLANSVVRLFIQDLVRFRLPNVSVLSYQDLEPNCPINSLDKVTLA